MSAARPPVALTVAGTDSSGGAGIVADVRTFAAFDVWPLVAITAVTAQSTTGVANVVPLPPAVVVEQIEVVAADIGFDAVKTGMLATGDIARAVAAVLADLGARALVVDPVLRATTGDPLADDDVADAIRDALLPKATVVTPNLAEAGLLCAADPPATRDEMEQSGRALLELGVAAVLVTGGHLDDAPADVLVRRDHRPVWIEGARVVTAADHGTGCVLSAALAAQLALGADVESAAHIAQDAVRAALRGGITLGRGRGVVDPRRIRGA